MKKRMIKIILINNSKKKKKKKGKQKKKKNWMGNQRKKNSSWKNKTYFSIKYNFREKRHTIADIESIVIKKILNIKYIIY